MPKATAYLDCGCAILEGGGRMWCPIHQIQAERWIDAMGGVGISSKEWAQYQALKAVLEAADHMMSTWDKDAEALRQAIAKARLQ